MVFSDVSGNTGIVQQARQLCRVDSTLWSTVNIVNSANNWHDTVTGYAIGNDKRFAWDDTNHSKLPIGTTDLTTSSDYSFLTDEQGNTILNLTSISLIEIATNKETKLEPIDRADGDYDYSSFGVETGTPSRYDKIADNIIKLDYIPTATDIATYKLKFYFQRTGSYFVATDTTKQPGIPPILHRGYVIAAAYDCALTLGLQNLQPLSVELQKEEAKIKQHFANRNTDESVAMSPCPVNPV